MIGLIIEEPGRPVRRLDSLPLPCVLGRSEDAEVLLNDDKASRRHLRLEAGPNGVMARDLQSGNGTFRGEDRVSVVLLRRGCQLRVGDSLVTFLGSDTTGPEAEPAAVFEVGEPGLPTLIVELAAWPASIGRDEAAEVPLRDERASRRHAVLELGTDPGTVRVTDEASANGTWRDGRRVASAVLALGQGVEIGDARITVRSVREQATLAEAPRLAGFEIRQHLGSGPVSDVYLAWQTALDRPVALRVLNARARLDEAQRARFSRQARAQARMRHGALATGIDVGEWQGVPYFITEALSGERLSDRVARSLGLPPSTVVEILRSLLELLVHAEERGEAVGSLVPRRLFVEENGVKLARLGCPVAEASRLRGDHRVDRAFLPPEALIGDPEAAGRRGDLFQVAALGSYLLSGRPPRDADTPVADVAGLEAPRAAANRSVPAALSEWIQQVGAARPADRPANAAEALERLERVAASLDSHAARRLEEGERLADRDRPAIDGRAGRRKAVSLGVTILIGAALNYGLYYWWTRYGPERPKPPELERSVVVAADPVPDPAVAAPALDEPSREPAPEEQAAAVAWAAVRDRVRDGAPGVRFAAYSEFVTQHPGTGPANDALLEARKLRERADRALDRVQEAVDTGSLAAARRALIAAVPDVEGVLDDRLGRLSDAVASLGGVRTPAVEPRPGPSAVPAPGPVTAPTRPAADLDGLLAAALERPADADRRSRYLAQARTAGSAGREFRALVALDRVLDGCIQSWVSSERVLSLRGRALTLRGREGDDLLVVSGDGGEERWRLDSLSSTDVSSLLEAAPRTVDGYLARALMDLRAGRSTEAWYDLQGVILVDSGGPDQALARAWLAESTAGAKAAARGQGDPVK